jgi:hypothetical protein
LSYINKLVVVKKHPKPLAAEINQKTITRKTVTSNGGVGLN